MNDRGILASYLMSPLSKVTSLKNKSHFILVNDRKSNRVNDLLIHNTIPVTLCDNLLTFRDTGKIIELKGHLLKMITNNNFNTDLTSLSDKKLKYAFPKKKYFDVNAPGNKSTRDPTLIKVPISPAIMTSGSSTNFLPENPNELCDKIKLLQQEKQAGKYSIIFNEEIVAIVDKMLEYKCISTKQHKILLLKGSN